MNQTDRIAEWMEKNGGTVGECAKDLGIPRETVKSTWKRLRHRYGE